jgi:enoyl-CoA hydratase/carnithine racemase
MATDSPVHVAREGDLAILRLRDGKANAMSPAQIAALAAAVDEIRASDARALVITAEGKAFCAGLALPELVDLDRATMTRFMDDFTGAMRCVLEFPRPTVAAITGHAIAGGCVLALMCDARIMTSAPAKIGLSEVQLGIGLPAVVIEPLRARVPATSLTRLALEGALVDGAEAQRLGLVDEVAAPDAVLPRALERARALATAGPAAYAHVKRALVRPIAEALAEHDLREREGWLDTWFSADGQSRLRTAVARLRG